MSGSMRFWTRHARWGGAGSGRPGIVTGAADRKTGTAAPRLDCARTEPFSSGVIDVPTTLPPPAEPSRPTAANAEQAIRRHLGDHWKGYALQGGLMALAGVLALLAPLVATLASAIFFGWLLLILGVVGLIATVRRRGSTGFGSGLLISALALLLGIVILFDPFAGAVTLTTLLSIYFLLSGLSMLSLANAFRPSTARFWLPALAGVLNVAMAVLLVLGLPGTALWASGVFLGISLLSSGLGLLLAALDARSARRP